MEFDFISYEKIVERPEEWKLDEGGYRRLRSLDWVVTEKIHGANFVLATDGKDVRFAKRKAWLEPEEEFFGYQLLAPALMEKALRLFTDLAAEKPAVHTVFIYGELFGGAYPHPSVPADPRVEAIQTGVYYSPSVNYALFDIAFLDPMGERRYLPVEEAISRGSAAGFFTVTPLLIAPYTKAIAFPLGFESTIPKQLGLPPLLPGNKAEGVVMKPVSAIVLPSGDLFRPVLKRKIPKFAEDPRYGEAQKWKPVATMIANEQAAMQLLTETLPTFLTPARFAGGLSKVGRLNDKNGLHRRQLIDVLWEDVLAKLESDLNDFWHPLSPPARRDYEGVAREAIKKWIETGSTDKS